MAKTKLYVNPLVLFQAQIF